MGKHMRSSVVMLILLAFCSTLLVQAQMQSVGGDFGRSWLDKYGGKPIPSDNANSLWAWGGAPKGYMVVGSQLYPNVNAEQWFYPGFLSNSTPILLNGSSSINSQNSMPTDFLSPDFVYYDPWTLAQITERPVVVRYPVIQQGSTLL
jgi:hypothetical protein